MSHVWIISRSLLGATISTRSRAAN